MKNLKVILALLGFSLTSSFQLAFALNGPPKLFIDKGACPFECCTYREWTVEKDTELYDSIDGKKIIGIAKKGSQIRGITGEVHTVPLEIKDNDGNKIYLLTYQGEGVWKVWDNGAVKTSVGQNWDGDPRPKSTWWVQVKLSTGIIGWTNKTGNFGNMDACG